MWKGEGKREIKMSGYIIGMLLVKENIIRKGFKVGIMVNRERKVIVRMGLDKVRSSKIDRGFKRDLIKWKERIW